MCSVAAHPADCWLFDFCNWANVFMRFVGLRVTKWRLSGANDAVIVTELTHLCGLWHVWLQKQTDFVDLQSKISGLVKITSQNTPEKALKKDFCNFWSLFMDFTYN